MYMGRSAGTMTCAKSMELTGDLKAGWLEAFGSSGAYLTSKHYSGDDLDGEGIDVRLLGGLPMFRSPLAMRPHVRANLVSIHRPTFLSRSLLLPPPPPPPLLLLSSSQPLHLSTSSSSPPPPPLFLLSSSTSSSRPLPPLLILLLSTTSFGCLLTSCHAIGHTALRRWTLRWRLAATGQKPSCTRTATPRTSSRPRQG